MFCLVLFYFEFILLNLKQSREQPFQGVAAKESQEIGQHLKEKVCLEGG